MCPKNFLTIVCIFQLVVATQQGWVIPLCDTFTQFEGHTLTMELACENEFSGMDSSFFFFLYPTEGDGAWCQWVRPSRQYSNICETSTQKHIRAVFEHVYTGNYCLVVYRGKWTTSQPICNSKIPFHLETELKEMDILLWNPNINLQQQGFNDLLIQLDDSQSDVYNFSKFNIEIHTVDETITDCEQLHNVSATKTYTVGVSGEAFILSNLAEGYYCVQVTPVDVRCIYHLSATTLPCTRSSNTTRITFSRSGDYQNTIVAVVTITFFLLSCVAVIVFVLKKKHNEPKKMKYSKRTEDGDISSVSIFLLHSNDERLRSSIKMLKETLQEELSPCEIEDYTDECQWESVAEEGISWFLSRLNQKQKYIIVIERFLEGDLFTKREFSENYYFHFVLQQLQSLASSSDYQRVLNVWFQNDCELECVPFERLGNPFTNFLIPEDFELLVQRIKNLEHEDYI